VLPVRWSIHDDLNEHLIRALETDLDILFPTFSALLPILFDKVLVFPLFGSEPMPNLNRTLTGPHVRFGVQQILDFAEPVRTCSNR
jgi:hypothetical protein